MTSMRFRSRRVVVLGVAAVLVALAIGIVWSSGAGKPAPGPLVANDAAGVKIRLRDGDTVTWGMILPTNPTTADITIKSIEPVAVTGLEVIDVLVSRISAVDGAGSISIAKDWPPPAEAMIGAQAPSGAVQPPIAASDFTLQVLVGVQGPTPATSGAIDELRMRYESGGVEYETILPWHLTVNEQLASPVGT